MAFQTAKYMLTCFRAHKDHWLQKYNWRTRENHYNETLPQYRVPINGTRLHFVHKRSPSPLAIPLLFCHGMPESFISVSRLIDALCDPLVANTSTQHTL